MDVIRFKINGEPFQVGSDVDSNLTLVDFIRGRANLFGTKYMCYEAGCGVCIVSVKKTPGSLPVAVNSCMVSVLSCHNWEITTIEQLGNRLIGYHPIQETLAKYNGTQCGYCSPGWVMSMYSLLESKKDLTRLEIEKSFSSNVCRCTGYRSILDAFKSFAIDNPKSEDINDIEDLNICKQTGSLCRKINCDDDWCIISKSDVQESALSEIILEDGKFWYRARKIADIFQILAAKGIDSYMLVAGNTAKGVYPINEYPSTLIDISGIEELKGYYIDQNLVVNAGTTLTELINVFDIVSQESGFIYLKMFNQHVQLVAHTAVRNLGSIAGNLMIKHHHNEFPSDIYLLLTVVDARLTILEKGKPPQIICMEEFLKVDMRGRVILNVKFPPLNNDNKVVTYKIMPRDQHAIAIVNAGFLYKYRNGKNKVLQSRIVYGGLSPPCLRARCTEHFLTGKVLFCNETLQEAVKILDTEIIVKENLRQASATCRKQLALALFYKSLLYLSPTENIHPRLRSAAKKLNESRPVSHGRQIYDTRPALYPLTKPIPKKEALIQCAGEASYTDDQHSDSNEVFAALVLSTVPTGQIVSIDPRRALEQPGAIAFYSAKDIPGLNSFTPEEDPFAMTNEEVFSSGEIKYFNQPIGVIAAKTKYIAKKLAKMVDVKYTNIKMPVIDVKQAKKNPKRNSLFGKIDAKSKGTDIEKVIKSSHTVRSQMHVTMETIACITRPTEDCIEVFTTTQWMDAAQSMISRALNIPQSRVDVYVRRLGGGFGLKITRSVLPTVACSLVTFKTNKPCRLIMPLSDITRALGKRFPCSADYEVAVDAKGKIQYLTLNMYEDNGFMINEKLQTYAVEHYNNAYDASGWNYKNISTITDTAKNSWYRAPGHLENTAIVEGIMEHISYEMSIDSVDVRLENLDKMSFSDLLEIINTLKEKSEYNKRKFEVTKFNMENRWNKRGLRTALFKWTSNSPRTFDVNLSVFHGDGSIIITHGGIEMGQGINTNAIQICGYLLNCPLNKIQIKANTTTVSPNGSVSGGSRTTNYISQGVKVCCLDLLKRLKPIREQFGNLDWEELIQKAYEMDVDLQVHGFVGTESAQSYLIFGMTVAEVEVDILTGEKQILRVDVLEDVGQSVNPLIDIGQIEGAFVHGLGYWLTENLVYDPASGELLTDRMLNYHLPQARDIPQDFRVYFRENSYSTEAIFGAKATGEPPICMAVAVPHAIREALSSARLESGIPTTSWFEIDGPYTLENVCMAAGTRITDLKFY